MRTLIDGYNLMHARGLLARRFGPGGFRKVRHRFLVELAAALDPIEAKQTTVVFDAANAPQDRPDRQKLKGIEVVFAVGDENADARIERLIASHSAPKALTVVSSDHRVRQAATRRKAKSVPAEDYLAALTDRRRKRPEAVPPEVTAAEKARVRELPPEEARFWLAEFASLADDPEIRESLRPSDFVPTDEEIARIEREVMEEG